MGEQLQTLCDLRARLLRSLVWLMPWTGFCTLGGGPAAPAVSVSVMNGYLRRRNGRIVMTVEHRAAPGLNDIEIELADDGEGPALRLRRPLPAEAAPEPETPEQRIVQALAEAATPLSQRQIRERAATRPATVAEALHKLIREGRVERVPEGGYRIAAAGPVNGGGCRVALPKTVSVPWKGTIPQRVRIPPGNCRSSR